MLAIGSQGLARGGSTASACAGGDGRTTSHEGDGLGRTAIVLQSVRVEAGVGDAHHIAIAAADQAAGTTSADQVVALVEDTVPAMSLADVVVPLPMVFSATIVLSSVAVPSSPPPRRH